MASALHKLESNLTKPIFSERNLAARNNQRHINTIGISLLYFILQETQIAFAYGSLFIQQTKKCYENMIL
jgi:hypothetical protein